MDRELSLEFRLPTSAHGMEQSLPDSFRNGLWICSAAGSFRHLKQLMPYHVGECIAHDQANQPLPGSISSSRPVHSQGRDPFAGCSSRGTRAGVHHLQILPARVRHTLETRFFHPTDKRSYWNTSSGQYARNCKELRCTKGLSWK